AFGGIALAHGGSFKDAAEELGRLRDKRAIELLALALKDDCEHVRAESALSLELFNYSTA
ncbi:MAG: HEAT repeat domain-containing protein, partial [Candidatus Thorarchaeota archaeon]